MTLMTFQPAPRKADSGSWMILPLPRTGPSSRCRLQLTTKVRLWRPSRDRTWRAPGHRGPDVERPGPFGRGRPPLPEEPPDARPGCLGDTPVLEIPVVAGLVDR